MIAEGDSILERSLEQCTVEIFDRLCSPELEDFVFSHDPNSTLKNNIPSKKGSLEEAKRAIQNGTPLENNRILTVYKCHSNPNKRALQANQRVAETSTKETSMLSIDFMEISLSDGNKKEVNPSGLLCCDIWITSTCELFDIGKTISDPLRNIDNEVKEKADLLVKVLRGRVQSLLISRIANRATRSHGDLTCQ
jgi:hypothetical protein